MESYKIIWDNKEVGQLVDPRPDMWYLEGNYESNQTPDSEKFERLMRSLDATQVFNDLSKGPNLVLMNKETQYDLNAIGISLDNGKLFVRQMVKPITETIQPKRGTLIDRILRLLKG
jgi:hypothetical protein